MRVKIVLKSHWVLVLKKRFALNSSKEDFYLVRSIVKLVKTFSFFWLSLRSFISRSFRGFT